MNNKQILEQVVEQISDTGESLLEYDGYKAKKDSSYDEGFNDAIQMMMLELLGRKNEDSAQLLAQAITGAPTKSKEIKHFNIEKQLKEAEVQ